jgi:hypothetical protein
MDCELDGDAAAAEATTLVRGVTAVVAEAAAEPVAVGATPKPLSAALLLGLTRTNGLPSTSLAPKDSPTS